MLVHVCRTFIVSLLVAGLLGQVASAIPSGVMSYREWKISKIHQSESRLKELKAKTKDPNLAQKIGAEAGLTEELQSEIEFENTNLSLSKDLTISDYFVGYLTQQGSLNAAVKDVAGRLSPPEVAELMLAYAEHFSRLQPSTVKLAPRAETGH